MFESTKYPDKEISIVFGCPGKKLRRRRELGEIAGKYSDKVYITEEDAGEEAVIKICEEIAEHIGHGTQITLLCLIGKKRYELQLPMLRTIQLS